MEKEVFYEGRSVDEALDKACTELGLDRNEVEFEIVSLPKKKLFGSIPAKVKIVLAQTKEDVAKKYLTDILIGMGVENLTINTTRDGDRVTFGLEGDDLKVAIGRRGETLDALQYLTSLAINRVEGDFIKISIDVGDYRQKREETLTALAAKISAQAIKNGRNVTLEPMNPYERRIIHSAVQKIEGVSSRSIGEEPNRKVIICPDVKKDYRSSRGEDRRRNGGERNSRPRREDSRRTASVSSAPVQTKDEAADKPLYGKIDLD